MKYLLFVFIICLALSAIAFAQEAPEATAEATAEATVEQLPAVEVTAEPTVEPPPTEEPTVEVTAELPPTEEATLEATVEPTVETPPEVTVEPTTEVPPPVLIAPEPAIGLLFADNFESGDVSAWIGGVGWVVLPGQMQAIDSNEPLTLVKGVYFNAVALARVQVTSGSAQVSVRSGGALGYTAAVDTAGNVTLSRAGVVVQTAITTLANPWTDIRLSAIGSVVRVAVNGLEVIVWNDDAPLPPGQVTISANFAPRTDPAAPSDTLTVEDFALFVPVEELPPPTAEPTIEAPIEVTVEPTIEAPIEVTVEPTIEVTAEPTEVVVSESVTSAAVNPPALKAPLDGAFVNTPRPTLSWFAVPGANRYRVDINTAPDFTGTVILDNREVPGTSILLNATHLPTALLQGRYYWRVQARETSTGDWSAELPAGQEFEFTVDLARNPNGNVLITQGAATTLRPAFSWTSAGRPSVNYTVQVWDVDDFTTPVYTNSVVITGTSHTVPAANALPWGEYFWRVTATGETLDPAPALNIGNLFTISPGLARVTLQTPAINAILYDNTVSFAWSSFMPATAAGGPFAYQIQINNVNNFNGALLYNNTQALTTYEHTVLPDGAYWWRVRPVNDFGAGTWSASRKFTIDRVAKPLRPLACTTNRRPTFGWDRVPGATRYNLLVDDDADFNSPVIDFTTANANGLSYTPPTTAPLAFDIYYWRVDFELDGAFVDAPAPSGIAQFCVTPTPLKAPTLISPANNAMISDTTLPNLTWNAVTDGANPVLYRVQVARTANFAASSIVLDDNDVAGTSLDDTALQPNGNYWWRVKTVNYLGAQSTAWSVVRKFTLDTVAPNTPTLKTPASGASTTNPRPLFTWNPISGTTYNFRVGTITIDSACVFTNPAPLIISTGTTASYTVPAPLLYTSVSTPTAKANYCWQVRAVDAAGNPSNWSAARPLIVLSAPNIAPIPNRFVTNQPTLTWTPISWATKYEIEIYRSSVINVANRVYHNPDITAPATSHMVALALPNGTYYWRVRAWNGTTAGNWSGTTAATLGIFQVEVP